MFVEMMLGKLHRATVTEADINYIGSATIDKELMKAAGFITNQKVQVVNINNGARFETYVIDGAPNSGVICINGAAARLVQPGDNVIIMAFGLMKQDEAVTYQPSVVFLNDKNEVTEIGVEKAEQNRKQ
jgi:aspartate 1-decarboxylase